MHYPTQSRFGVGGFIVPMAQRRMFSKDITEHDAFLEMPLSTQALYFHLGMQADDDGFVSPNRIMRMIGAQPDDLKILITKKFVLSFEDGILVIKHWKINNYLRIDRYKETRHKEKMALIIEKSNGSYSWYTSGIPVGIPLVDAGKVRLGKVTSEADAFAENKTDNNMPINKYSDDYEEGFINADGDGSLEGIKKPQTKKYPNAPAVRKVFQEVLGLNPANWKVNKNQLLACENLFTERGIEKVKNALEFYKENKDREFCPRIDSPYDLDAKYVKLSQFKTKS